MAGITSVHKLNHAYGQYYQCTEIESYL